MSHGRVLIVEDERFTRTMIATTVAALGFEVVGATATAEGALTVIRSAGADVALLDLDLGPGPSGIDVAYALRAEHQQLGLVFLTSFSDPRIKDPRERPLPPGARYVVKTRLDSADELRTTLTQARLLPLGAQVALGAMGPESAALPLTEHQIAVLRLIAAGRTNADIAAALGVTEKAVERTAQRTAEALGLAGVDGNQRVHMARAYAQLTGKPMTDVHP